MDLQGESAITVEHVENNTSVRDMLGQRGINRKIYQHRKILRNWNAGKARREKAC